MLIQTIVQDTGNATTAAWITSHAKTTIFLILFMDGVISPPTFAVEKGIVTVDPAMMNVVRAMTSSVHSLMDFLKILKTAWSTGSVTMISHNIILVTHVSTWLYKDSLIDGRRSLIWEVRLGG